MKKSIYLFFTCICFLLLIAGCDNTTKLVNLSSSDIKDIEIYRLYFLINEDEPSYLAEKKVVTGENDIKTIINDINSIKIKGKAMSIDETIGGLTFVFNKADGTLFVIDYNSSNIKNPDDSTNRLGFEIEDSSLFSKWDNLNYTAQKISLDEMPTVN